MNEFNGDATKTNMLLGKVLYGLFFVGVVPIALVVWSRTLDKAIEWPVPEWPVIGLAAMLIGGLFMFAGMVSLAVLGNGLPMNAYPPQKLVSGGVYVLFAHPIYLGAALLSAGTALAYQSSSGLYVVTPILTLMMAALVIGYERLTMQKRFGQSLAGYGPLFSIPAADDESVSRIKKGTMVVRVFGPWLMIGFLIDYARCDAACGATSILLSDKDLLADWQAVLWLIPVAYVGVRLLFARTRWQLLRHTLVGTLASGLSLYLYLVLPGFGIPIANAWGLALLTTLTTALAINHRVIWSLLRRLSERVANSRHDWHFADGRLRIMNHSIYVGLSGAVGVAIISYLIGNTIVALLLLVCVLVGAAVFAQVWWGSNALLRPFGFWGGVWGSIVGVALVYALFDIPLSNLAVATILCAPFVQALGRLRCLVQGCCHGVPASSNVGIRVWQPQSRVVALSGLEGVWIHCTQMYSILFNLLLGPLLWAMWSTRSLRSSFIVGMYLVLTSIERFAEDGYRGETQTKTIKGLLESQWVAVVGLLIGLAVTIIPSGVPMPAAGRIDLPFVGVVLVAGFIGAFAMGMDFPQSRVRFSRLSG